MAGTEACYIEIIFGIPESGMAVRDTASLHRRR